MKVVPVISVVDDDCAVRSALDSLIRSLGYESRLYPSAQAFLADVEQHRPCCLISDIHMPHMSGLELKRHLNDLGLALPTIFITAFAEPAVEDQACDVGGVCFLPKPFSMQALIACIDRALLARRYP